MRLTLNSVVFAALLAVGTGTFVGCGSSSGSGDKMRMTDHKDGKMTDRNMKSDDKMRDGKMGMEAPMNNSMEPMKMDGKMADGKMGDRKSN
jgi:hypothetical protein